MTEAADPSLSIIVPTHNRPSLLAEALESIRGQSVPPDEVIVVDDASTPPACMRHIQALIPDIALQLVRHDPSRGGWAARNTGATCANSEWVCFLDDDDLLRADFVARTKSAVKNNPAVDVFFNAVRVFGDGEDGRTQRGVDDALSRLITEVRWHASDDGVLVEESGLFGALLRSVPMAFQRYTVRQASFEKVGGLRGYRTWWDGEWAIRAAGQLRAALIPEQIHLWRVSGQGYFSQRDSTESVLQVEVEIKRQLGRDFSGTPFEELVRDAIRCAHLAYADWLFQQPGRAADALRSWRNALGFGPSIEALKVIPRAIRQRARALRG